MSSPSEASVASFFVLPPRCVVPLASCDCDVVGCPEPLSCCAFVSLSSLTLTMSHISTPTSMTASAATAQKIPPLVPGDRVRCAVGWPRSARRRRLWAVLIWCLVVRVLRLLLVPLIPLVAVGCAHGAPCSCHGYWADGLDVWVHVSASGLPSGPGVIARSDYGADLV